MTPEQKAIAKERGAKAVKQMRECGFPGKKIVVVIKRLLKSLDFNWELIEAENYSILVDAIISLEEPEACAQLIEEPLGKSTEEDERGEDGNGQIVPAEIPLCRKRHGPNQEEQPSTREITLKKPKLEQDPLPENDIQQNQHNGLERNTRGSTDLVSPEPSSRPGKSNPVNSLANAKGKGILIDSSHGHSGPISPRAHRKDKGPSVGRAQPLVSFKEPKVEPDTESIPKEVVSSNPCHHDNNVPDGHPTTFEVPIANTSSKTTEGPDSHQKGSQVGDCCPSNGNNMKASPVQKLNKNGDAECLRTHPSSAKLEIASSANGKVKLLLSWEETNANFHMPIVDSILKVVEDRLCISQKSTPPEFSFKKIMTEMCQMFLELSKSGDSGHGSIVTDSL